MAKKTVKRKTVKAKPKSRARAVKTRATRTTVRAKPKTVAFYKQPVVALSSGFDRVFSFFK